MILSKESKGKLKELFRDYILDKRYIREHGEGLKTFNMIVKEFKGLIPRHTITYWLKKEFPEISEQMSTKHKIRKYY